MPKVRFQDYLVPETIEEALEKLNLFQERSKIIAGGTTFFELSQRGLFSDVDYIIDLQSAGLDFVREDLDYLSIGATMVMSDLLMRPLLARSAYSALMESIKCVEPIQVRNVATIGGAVCASISFFDVPISLIVLDSEAVVRSSTGTRIVSLDDFYLDYLTPDLNSNEVLTEVRIPKRGPKSGSSFMKLGRSGFDIGLVTCGTRVDLRKDSTVAKAKIVVGNVDKIPFRARELEHRLEGRRVDEINRRFVADGIQTLSPVASVHGSPEYKKELTTNLVLKTVMIAAERADEANLKSENVS